MKKRKRPDQQSSKEESLNPSQGRHLARFERWQVGFAIAQTIIGVLTITAAVYIGLQQNAINHKLYDLNFNPSLEITYENGRLNVANKGKENIWLCGTKLANKPPGLEAEGRLITPGGFYYILGDRLEQVLTTMRGASNEVRVPCDVFIQAANGRKYTTKVLLWAVFTTKGLEVHAQTLAFQSVDTWPTE